ncbi:MAG TPA: hypothetical protein VEA69_19410 [Tepidisphaeraceae bacterium]|nr:hypothetical protein [Tepidisphaeraceae bacterium]
MLPIGSVGRWVIVGVIVRVGGVGHNGRRGTGGRLGPARAAGAHRVLVKPTGADVIEDAVAALS